MSDPPHHLIAKPNWFGGLIRPTSAKVHSGRVAARVSGSSRTVFITLLLLKLLLVPALVLGVTLAGRRWGPETAGWLSAFPILSGPILLILALEHGAGFAATAAQFTLLAVLAILIFSVAYAWIAQRRGWPDSLLIALCCYALAVIGLRRIEMPLPSAFATVIAALLLAPFAFPAVPRWISNRTANKEHLALRVGSAALLVLLVTFGAQLLGPRWSGLLAMFPVMSSVLVAFSHQESGAGYAVRMLRGMLQGYFSFACFCAVLAFALPELGIARSFIAALAVAVPVHWLARRLLRS